MSWRESLAPLRERNFAWYYAARVVNTAGSVMASIALAFAVLDITDSASALGQVLAARTIPMVVFLLFGGVIADRFPRTTVMQVSNVLSALTQGTVAYLVISGHAHLPTIIALEAVNGMVSAVSFPAMASVLPQLVPREQLQSANVLVSMSRGVLAIVGPTVAALLVATVGSGWALAADAAAWALSALFLLPVRIPARPARAVEEQAGGQAEKASMVRELREGWSVFVGNTWLWVVVAAFGVLNAIHAGAFFTLGPALAKETFGPRGWGLALSAESAGLLIMTVVLLRVRFRYPLRAGMVGIAFLAVPLVMLGLDPAVLPLVGAMFLAGLGEEIFGIGWNLAMQENVDEAVLSRAYSYDALGSFVAMPVGQLLYGPLGDAFGYRPVLLVSGLVYAAVCVATLCVPAVRRLPRRTVEPAVVPAAQEA